ncbi:hypothetical protein WA026_021060 [Henosepilachna vigintioctopunctata]|uniref:Uncharacterized protein n=1 Tax=Henosepilachna vigintioctopunctata TaxID=420089 RepID=A0AAW1UUW8_9CUCU
MNFKLLFFFAVVVGLFAISSANPEPNPEPEPVAEPEPVPMPDPKLKWKHISRGLDVADAAANIAGLWWG